MKFFILISFFIISLLTTISFLGFFNILKNAIWMYSYVIILTLAYSHYWLEKKIFSAKNSAFYILTKD